MTRELWTTKVRTERGIFFVKIEGGCGWIDTRQNKEERMDRACDGLVATGDRVVAVGRRISLRVRFSPIGRGSVLQYSMPTCFQQTSFIGTTLWLPQRLMYDCP